MKKQYIFMVGGGTFGHIKPCITIAEELDKLKIDNIFICAKKDKVFPLVKERDIEKIFFLNMLGRPSSKYNFLLWIKFIYKVLWNFIRVFFLFLSKKPKMVLSSGGYVAFPVLLWASIFKVPFSILEQNSVPGLVSRTFFKKAKHIYLTMQLLDTQYHHYKNMQLVGNPINFKSYSKREAINYFRLKNEITDKEVIGVAGGSLGAKDLVQWVLEQKPKDNQVIVCITGYEHFKIVEKLELDNIIFLPFVKDMEYFYSVSDYLITRSGASTISELFFYQKPVALVPYPLAKDNHQFYNAKFASLYLQSSIILQDLLYHSNLSDIILQLKQDTAEKKSCETLLNAKNKIIKDIKEII